MGDFTWTKKNEFCYELSGTKYGVFVSKEPQDSDWTIGSGCVFIGAARSLLMAQREAERWLAGYEASL